MALEGSIARRYARALLDIGVEEHNYERVGQEIDKVAELINGSEELRNALTNPVFGLFQRTSVLAALCDRLGVLPSVRHFLLLLIDRGRIARLPDVAREMRHLVDKQAGRVRAKVVSAVPLTEELTRSLRVALEERMGKKIVLEQQHDPALLGGLVAKVGDVVFDNSIRSQLELAQEQLLSE